MRRTSIFLDPAIERDLEILARRRGLSKSSLVREALARYVAVEKGAAGRGLSFAAIGGSGRSDVAERHEEILAEEWAAGARD